MQDNVSTNTLANTNMCMLLAATPICLHLHPGECEHIYVSASEANAYIVLELGVSYTARLVKLLLSANSFIMNRR